MTAASAGIAIDVHDLSKSFNGRVAVRGLVQQLSMSLN